MEYRSLTVISNGTDLQLLKVFFSAMKLNFCCCRQDVCASPAGLFISWNVKMKWLVSCYFWKSWRQFNSMRTCLLIGVLLILQPIF